MDRRWFTHGGCALKWKTGDDDTNVDNISLPGGGPTGVAGDTPSARGVVMRPAFPNPSGGPGEIAFTLDHPGQIATRPTSPPTVTSAT